MSQEVSLEEIQKISQSVARKFLDSVPHLSYEDLCSEIQLHLLGLQKTGHSGAYLQTSATNLARDLARKGKRRAHLSLQQPTKIDEEGNVLTLGDILENEHHPDLISHSAEVELLGFELRARIGQYIEEIPTRARDIHAKKLAHEPLNSADRSWLHQFRLRVKREVKEDIEDYLNL